MPYIRKPYQKYEKKKSWQKTDAKPTYQSRRGKLSPLMTEESKSTANIQDLSYDFSCRIIRLYQYLTEDSKYKEYIISKQVIRSGTSIGANVSEAENGQSKADFYAKMSIAAKEANETNYWLRLLHDNGYISNLQYTSLDTDMQRVLNKLKAIVKSTKSSLDQQKSSKNNKSATANPESK